MLKQFPTIKEVNTYLIEGTGSGGDYHNQKSEHWITGSPPYPQISNPMSRYDEYKTSRLKFGINVLGSFVVEIIASNGQKGIATGFGGPPACWLVMHHFTRFLINADPRNTNMLWDQMWSASMFYGRKGLPIAVISVVDLALWDLVGKIRKEPVYKMIGGHVRSQLKFYCTGPDPVAVKKLGFFGAKVPLPYPQRNPTVLKKTSRFSRSIKNRSGISPLWWIAG